MPQVDHRRLERRLAHALCSIQMNSTAAAAFRRRCLYSRLPPVSLVRHDTMCGRISEKMKMG
jgi:hypothetical protein